MRNRLLSLALGLTLSACALSPKDPAQDVFALRAGFDSAVLAPAVAYASLPACPQATGQPCADHAVVLQLDKGIHAAIDTLDAAEKTVRDHPTMDASADIAAAGNAVDSVRKILVTYNIH